MISRCIPKLKSTKNKLTIAAAAIPTPTQNQTERLPLTKTAVGPSAPPMIPIFEAKNKFIAPPSLQICLFFQFWYQFQRIIVKFLPQRRIDFVVHFMQKRHGYHIAFGLKVNGNPHPPPSKHHIVKSTCVLEISKDTMRNILYLIEDILFRSKQENTAESVRNHLYRLRQHKQSNNDGHDLVEIRRNFLSRRFSQKNLREESQRNTDAAKKSPLKCMAAVPSATARIESS